MDRSKKINYAFLAVLAVMFNFFFWGEKLGANLFIFLTVSAVAVIMLNEDNVKSKNVLSTLLAVLFCAAMVIVNNSGYSKFSAIVSFMVFTGYIHQPRLKSVYSAFFTAVSGFLIFPYNVYAELKSASGSYKPVRTVLKIFKLAVIPVVIFIVFYSIYAYSNPVFNSYSNTFWNTIGEYLYKIFKDYPVLRFFYIFFGLFLITGILFNRKITVFSDIDSSFLDSLIRNREFKTYSRVKPLKKRSLMYDLFSYRFKPNTLKLEYKMGLILIVMMNVLLMFLNILDIRFTWFGFEAAEVENLAYYVHNGTYLLIFSILLSMAILLYFFRGNQNFYTQGALLRYGAVLWIFQNSVMAVSVALRNLYYINYYYALSYKRIGVVVFLLLTFTGLVLMFLKIRNRKTAFWLLKTNTAAVFIMLLLMSSFSWDYAIAKFNLSNPEKNKVDVEYLLRLSDDALPVLDKHRDVLNTVYIERRGFFSDSRQGLEEYSIRVDMFLENQKHYTWLSWNLADYNTMKYYAEKDYKRKYDK